MELATQIDINRYKNEARLFLAQPHIIMFAGYTHQQLLIMEFLASKENKTIYETHFKKWEELHHTLAEN